MKIRTWNVNKAFSKKAELVFRDEPDIVVLPESHRDYNNDGWVWNWVGDYSKSGLGVAIKRDISGKNSKRICNKHQWFSMSELKTENPAVVAGVWACYEKSPRKNECGPLNSCLEELLEAIEGSSAIIAGDFNNGAYWDKEGRVDNFMNTVNALREAGYVSAYHTFMAEEFGKESMPTFFSKRNRTQAYHIDYCFIPESWADMIHSVTVGTYEDWIKLSDHMPMTIELKESFSLLPATLSHRSLRRCVLP